MNISPHSSTMLNTTNAEFSSIEVWFTDHNNKPLEIEDNVNFALIIGQKLLKWDIQQNQNTENTLKETTVCHLQKKKNLVINMTKN